MIISEASRRELEKMFSLIERIENNPYGRLVEAKNKRVQVSRDEFLDILNQAADGGTPNGQFASITYVKPADVYKTKKSWRQEDMQKALDASSDRSGEQWHKDLTSFQNDEMKKNPVSQIIVAQRYQFHWTSPSQFKKRQQEFYDATDDNRLRHGLPLKFRDPTVSHREFDSVSGLSHNETVNTDGNSGNVSLNFNMAGIKPETHAYLVGDDGHIMCDLPDGVYSAMRMSRSYGGPEKEAVEALKDNPEILASYTAAKKEIDDKFRIQNFKADSILCMAASVNGTSYYFINDNLQTLIAKKSEIRVDPVEWISIASYLLHETFEAIDSGAFAKNKWED